MLEKLRFQRELRSIQCRRCPAVPPPLPLRRLGRSPVHVTELSFGGAAIGGLYTEVSDDDARATVDAAWAGGNYTAPPEKGIRLMRDILNLISARTPDMYSAQFKNGMDALPWMEAQETALLKAMDANDYIYQTWAYERHDVGTTPGFNGDTAKALASIKAKTLILTGTKDLLNPEFEPTEMGKNIVGVKMITISPGTVTGHASAGGAIPADVEFLNRETSAFLDGVTDGGKKLK